MLDFDRFGPEAVQVSASASLGAGLRLVFDPKTEMALTVRRGARATPNNEATPTLVVHGKNRAQDDWLGLEIDLPHPDHNIELTARNYPVHRLFPRLHFDHPGGTGHIDLPDVAASDAFATRFFAARQWTNEPQLSIATAIRLTILIPSTPWFAMEIQQISLRELARA